MYSTFPFKSFTSTKWCLLKLLLPIKSDCFLLGIFFRLKERLSKTLKRQFIKTVSNKNNLQINLEIKKYTFQSQHVSFLTLSSRLDDETHLYIVVDYHSQTHFHCSNRTFSSCEILHVRGRSRTIVRCKIGGGG